MKRKNAGYATVEACLVVPLFLFFILALGEMIMMMFAEAHIHQSLVEAADYTAQYSYLENRLIKKNNEDSSKYTRAAVNTAILIKQFYCCLGDDFYVKKLVQNGKHGILLSVKEDKKNRKIFIAKVSWYARINIPILGEFRLRFSDVVKKKSFVGYEQGENGEEEEYVYITPNQEVYHKKRSCSHLEVRFHGENGIGKDGYEPCGFCGRERNTQRKIYVTTTTKVYHTRKDCCGLKRTVYRVKKRDVGALGPCQRCGR